MVGCLGVEQLLYTCRLIHMCLLQLLNIWRDAMWGICPSRNVCNR